MNKRPIGNSILLSEWLTLSDVAELLGVHSSTVRNWADQGRLPVHRTQGGHRRFRRSEVELCIQTEQADGAGEVTQVVQNALKRTRIQVSEGRLEDEEWYRKIDAEARDQYRLSGRALMQGLIGALSSDEANADAEARALGYEYASRGRRCGLNSSEAIQAFLFFRNMLIESMLGVYESASVRSPHAWGGMLRKINTFTDQILLTLIETYEAFQKVPR